MTNANKRRVVTTFFRAYPEAAKLTDVLIASKCGVSDAFVNKIRRELGIVSDVRFTNNMSMMNVTGMTSKVGKTMTPTKKQAFLEAADALAEAVRGGIFGCTRDVERRTEAAGFSDPREWVEARLEAYDRARRLIKDRSGL
jgi:DNA-binding MurR/RpiR family transcriptional regulator